MFNNMLDKIVILEVAPEIKYGTEGKE